MAIELEENIKRSDLPWQDQVKAIQKFHDFKTKTQPSWNLEQTADALGLNASFVCRCNLVYAELKDERVSSCTGVKAAVNVVERIRARRLDSALSDVRSISFKEEPAHGPASEPDGEGEEPSSPAPTEPSSPIINTDFLSWVESYTGPGFNFLHCDFPYGVGHNDTDQGGSSRWGSYEDSEDVYWDLCRGLAANLDKVLLPSAHVIFWFSMTQYQATLDFFTENTDLRVHPFPLIWLKSDNRGILPDPNRGPRQIYETALFMSRGDRKITRAVGNGYAAPSAAERIHISEKPEPVLHHFFRMVVDEYTTLLDPTCGSGSALRAAARLGCTNLLGLELNPEYAASAQEKFHQAQIKARLAGEI